jgi:hypothetical protein
MRVQTCIEGTLGFLLVAYSVLGARTDTRTDYEALDYLMGYHNSHIAWLLYPIDCANLLINAMLLVASALCWKL